MSIRNKNCNKTTTGYRIKIVHATSNFRYLCYIFLFGAIIRSTNAEGPLGRRKPGRTGYACEGQELKISCDTASITVVRANYGRYSISICNDHGNLDWKVDCTSAKSYNVISNRCNGKTNCAMVASSDDFDDPCPGTRKYLEVQYQCSNNKLSGEADGSPIKEVISSEWNVDDRRNRLNNTAISKSIPLFVDGVRRPVVSTPSPSLPSLVVPSSTSIGNSGSASIPIREVIPRDSTDTHNKYKPNGLANEKSISLSSFPDSSVVAGYTSSPPSYHAESTTNKPFSQWNISSTSKRPAIIAPLTQLYRTISNGAVTSSTTAPNSVTIVPVLPEWHNERFFPSNINGLVTTRSSIPIRTETTTRDFWEEFKKSLVNNKDESSTSKSITLPTDNVHTASPAEVYTVPTAVPFPLGPTSLQPPSLMSEDETYKMLLVIISCLVAVIFCSLTLGLLISSRTRCNRLTIYKNLCVNLILAELALVLIVYRPPIESSPFLSFVIPFTTHLLLLNIFIWSFIETARVYCCRARNCDISKLFYCCKCISTPTLCLHLVSYGIPLISVATLGALYPDVYLASQRRHYYWISLNSISEAGWAYSPAIAGIITSLVLLILLLVIRNPSDNKHEQSRDLKDRSVLPSMVILACQTPNWILANLYFLQLNSSIFFTSSFAVINIVQSVILFVLCFSQNDRVRGNIQNSLSKVQWLPQCVRNGKPTALVSSSPQTPAYFYSLDPTQHLAPPPSPLIRQTLQLHSNHLLHHHSQQALPQVPNNNLSNTMRNGGVGYISEVNPYAAPVPVPMHDYEDIGTALRDINSFGVTLPHNLSQHQLHNNQQQQRDRSVNTTARGVSASTGLHPNLRHSLHQPTTAADAEALYYEACRDGQVIYGRNPVPNYCFHNTRSPIYYSEGTRR